MFLHTVKNHKVVKILVKISMKIAIFKTCNIKNNNFRHKLKCKPSKTPRLFTRDKFKNKLEGKPWSSNNKTQDVAPPTLKKDAKNTVRLTSVTFKKQIKLFVTNASMRTNLKKLSL